MYGKRKPRIKYYEKMMKNRRKMTWVMKNKSLKSAKTTKNWLEMMGKCWEKSKKSTSNRLQNTIIWWKIGKNWPKTKKILENH